MSLIQLLGHMVVLQFQLVGFALLQLCHLLEILSLGCLIFLLQSSDLLFELLNNLLLLKQLDIAINLPRFLAANVLAILHLIFEMHAHFIHSYFYTLLQYLDLSPLLFISHSFLSQTFLGIVAALFIILNEDFHLILREESLT